MILAETALFIVPIILVGRPEYPSAQWRSGGPGGRGERDHQPRHRAPRRRGAQRGARGGGQPPDCSSRSTTSSTSCSGPGMCGPISAGARCGSPARRSRSCSSPIPTPACCARQRSPESRSTRSRCRSRWTTRSPTPTSPGAARSAGAAWPPRSRCRRCGRHVGVRRRLSISHWSATAARSGCSRWPGRPRDAVGGVRASVVELLAHQAALRAGPRRSGLTAHRHGRDRCPHLASAQPPRLGCADRCRPRTRRVRSSSPCSTSIISSTSTTPTGHQAGDRVALRHRRRGGASSFARTTCSLASAVRSSVCCSSAVITTGALEVTRASAPRGERRSDVLGRARRPGRGRVAAVGARAGRRGPVPGQGRRPRPRAYLGLARAPPTGFVRPIHEHMFVAERPRSPAILHADLDAFYASVEQRDDPSLRGRPVIVGGGVVLASSYEAARVRRAHGHGRPARAAAVAHGRLSSRRGSPPTPRPAEPCSRSSTARRRSWRRCRSTEAFLDVRGLERISGTPLQIAARLRREVRDLLGLPITVGIASTKFLAKVASGVAKPDGLLRSSPPAPSLRSCTRSRSGRCGAWDRRPRPSLRAPGSRPSPRSPGCGSRRSCSCSAGPADATCTRWLTIATPARCVPGRAGARSVPSARSAAGITDPSEVQLALTALVDRVTRRLRAAGRACRTVVPAAALCRLRSGDSLAHAHRGDRLHGDAAGGRARAAPAPAAS